MDVKKRIYFVKKKSPYSPVSITEMLSRGVVCFCFVKKISYYRNKLTYIFFLSYLTIHTLVQKEIVIFFLFASRYI